MSVKFSRKWFLENTFEFPMFKMNMNNQVTLKATRQSFNTYLTDENDLKCIV